MRRIELVHARQELTPEIGQLLRPDRRGALDGEDAAGEGPRARVGGDRVAGRARPGAVRPRLVARVEPREGGVEDLAYLPRVARVVLRPVRDLMCLGALPALAGVSLMLCPRPARSLVGDERKLDDRRGRKLVVGEVVAIRRCDDRLPDAGEHRHE